MKRIGLTGGIGVGKSCVAKLFQELGGVPILDADQVARSLRVPGGEAEGLIQKRFGTTDSPSLRHLLSTDPTAKRDLEAILHPLIREKSEIAFQKLEAEFPQAPFLIYEASLLIESGRKNDFQALIVVTAPLPDRLSRIMKRDGVTKEAALAFIGAQSPDEYRVREADYLIENLGSLHDLREQVRKVLDQIKST